MKTILLTGASGGIGAAIKNELEALGHRVIATTQADANLGKWEDIVRLKERVLATGAQLDWVICAHGFIDTEQTLEQVTQENIETTFAVNTLSIIYLAQQLLPHITQGGGVIALSSAAGLEANGRMAVYSASKAAVNNFMQGLARNRPEQKFFAVCPGPTNTPMRERVAHDAAKQQAPSVVAAVVADLIEGRGDYLSGDVVLVKNGETSIAQRI